MRSCVHNRRMTLPDWFQQLLPPSLVLSMSTQIPASCETWHPCLLELNSNYSQEPRPLNPHLTIPDPEFSSEALWSRSFVWFQLHFYAIWLDRVPYLAYTISCLYLVQYVISLMTNPVSTFRSVFKTTDKFSEHGLSVVFCWSLLSGSPGASIFLADATTYQIAICTLSRRPELVFSNFWSWPRENWLWQFHFCCIYSKRHYLMPTNTSSRS